MAQETIKAGIIPLNKAKLIKLRAESCSIRDPRPGEAVYASLNGNPKVVESPQGDPLDHGEIIWWLN